MRGDLQCNTIFFQPKGWKTAGRLHRSHQTIFQSFDGRSVLCFHYIFCRRRIATKKKEAEGQICPSAAD
jgi:hypothetical protein